MYKITILLMSILLSAISIASQLKVKINTVSLNDETLLGDAPIVFSDGNLAVKGKDSVVFLNSKGERKLTLKAVKKPNASTSWPDLAYMPDDRLAVGWSYSTRGSDLAEYIVDFYNSKGVKVASSEINGAKISDYVQMKQVDNTLLVYGSTYDQSQRKIITTFLFLDSEGRQKFKKIEKQSVYAPRKIEFLPNNLLALAEEVGPHNVVSIINISSGEQVIAHTFDRKKNNTYDSYSTLSSDGSLWIQFWDHPGNYDSKVYYSDVANKNHLVFDTGSSACVDGLKISKEGLAICSASSTGGYPVTQILVLNPAQPHSVTSISLPNLGAAWWSPRFVSNNRLLVQATTPDYKKSFLSTIDIQSKTVLTSKIFSGKVVQIQELKDDLYVSQAYKKNNPSPDYFIHRIQNGQLVEEKHGGILGRDLSDLIPYGQNQFAAMCMNWDDPYDSDGNPQNHRYTLYFFKIEEKGK